MDLKVLNDHPLKTLLIIYFAMLAGVLAFAGVMTYLLYSQGWKGSSLGNNTLFLIALLVFSIIQIGCSIIIPKKHLKEIHQESSLEDRLSIYRTANIIRFACIEGVLFFSLVVLVLTGSPIVLLVFIILLGIFLFYKPSLEKTIKELNLNMEDAYKLKKGEIQL